MTEATGETTAPSKTLGAVVGENVRRLRESRELTQHELAQVWKRRGLNWARSKIAALEAGHRPRVDCAELVMMAAGLGVTVAELFEGEGEVHLTPHPGIADRKSLRSVFNGERIITGTATGSFGFSGSATGTVISSEADAELARRLGVSTEVVIDAASGIFDGRTLTEERDRRVANLGQMSMSERMAHRGHVTRELATLVEDYLTKAAGERDR